MNVPFLNQCMFHSLTNLRCVCVCVCVCVCMCVSAMTAEDQRTGQRAVPIHAMTGKWASSDNQMPQVITASEYNRARN